MSLNPLPRVRTNVPPEELTWNEHFYLCLGKLIWILATLVLFGIIIMIRMILGNLGGFLQIALMFFVSLGGIYICIAMPASIIYAFVMRKRYAKK